MKFITGTLLLVAFQFTCEVCCRFSYILYDTGKSELRVKNVNRQISNVVNTFNIQTETASGGLAIDSARDQFFFAEGRNIYKIYLVDNNGKRRISANGELFWKKGAQHFEVRLFVARRKIEGIYYDKNSTKLFAAADTDLIELNSTTGKVLNSIYVGYNRYVRNPFMHRGNMYVYLHYGRQRYYGYTWGIYDDKKREYRNNALVYGNGEHISGFTVDEKTGRLYLNMRSTIRVIDVNNSTALERENPRIVLGDSQFTRGLQSIAIHEQYIFWGSSKLNKLYRGKLQNGVFIRKNDVVVVDENVTSHHLCVFNIGNIGDVAEGKAARAAALKRNIIKDEAK